MRPRIFAESGTSRASGRTPAPQSKSAPECRRADTARFFRPAFRRVFEVTQGPVHTIAFSDSVHTAGAIPSMRGNARHGDLEPHHPAVARNEVQTGRFADDCTVGGIAPHDRRERALPEDSSSITLFKDDVAAQARGFGARRATPRAWPQGQPSCHSRRARTCARSRFRLTMDQPSSAPDLRSARRRRVH